MKLLINGLSARLGGGQTYLYQLLQHLPQHWQVTLISSGGLMASQIPATIRHVVMPGLANPIARAAWEWLWLERFARTQGCTLIFNPACLLPPFLSSRIKTAVTFQNMLPFDAMQRRSYPLFSYRRVRDALLARGLLSAMRRADLVVFISDYARRFITEQQNITPRQAVTIPHAVDAAFFAPAPLPSQLGGAPYFLYVSFLDFYKCQREVLQAYAALKSQREVKEKLVLAGTGYAPYTALVKQDIHALRLEHDVVLLGNVAHALLPSLYQHARINLFASTCENCPNILWEIMASGVPALVSNYGPMPELAGDTVQYCDPRRHPEFVAAWAEMLDQPEAAKARAQRAMERVREHRWEYTIAQTARAFEMAVGAA